MNHATQILQHAVKEMADRAKTYDNEAGERSMDATVTAFEAVTGHSLTVEQGWLFMALLKAVRSQQGAYREDSYVDGAAYFGLAGEAACEARNGGWTPAEVEKAKLPAAPKFHPLPEWPEESRIDTIGQNGNDGAVYQNLTLFRDLAPDWATRLFRPAGSGCVYAQCPDGRSKKIIQVDSQAFESVLEL